MHVSHWTIEYPHPASPHSGHAIKPVIEGLQECCPQDSQDVYHFRQTMGTKLLAMFSKTYRVRRELLDTRLDESNVSFVKLPILPKMLLDRWINPRWQRRGLLRWARTIPCDLLHVHSCRSLAYGATVLGEDRNIPVVLTLRREIIPGVCPDWTRHLLIDAVRRADKVLAPSAHLAQWGRETAGVDVEVIPSGTRELFSEAPPESEPRKRQILFVGSLDANKAVHVLIDAVLSLRARQLDVELILVGKGPAGDAFRAQAASCSAIRFLGQLPPLEVRAHMRESMLLCVPSYTETLGIVYLEAMKQGLPVIGRAGAGIDGMGTRGEHYEVIDRDEDLLDLLDAMLRNSARCRNMAEAAQELARGWTWKANARRHAEIYQELVRSRPERRSWTR